MTKRQTIVASLATALMIVDHPVLLVIAHRWALATEWARA